MRHRQKSQPRFTGNAPQLRNLARALGGEIRDGAVQAPGPGMPADDRSLTVSPSFGSPVGVLIISRIVPRLEAQRYVLDRLQSSKCERTQPDLFGRSA